MSGTYSTAHLPKDKYLGVEIGMLNLYLISARGRAGLSTNEVARRIGVAHQRYLGYEKLKTLPSKKTRERIAALYSDYGISLTEEDIFTEGLRLLSSTEQPTGTREPEMIPLSCLSREDRELFERSACYSPEGQKRLETSKNYAAFEVVLGDILPTLTPRERHVFFMRFGFYVYEPMTFPQIGRALGVSKQRAKDAHDAVIKKFRKHPEIGELRQFM